MFSILVRWKYCQEGGNAWLLISASIIAIRKSYTFYSFRSYHICIKIFDLILNELTLEHRFSTLTKKKEEEKQRNFGKKFDISVQD